MMVLCMLKAWQINLPRVSRDLGGTITAQEAVDPNQTDFKSVLTSLAPAGPELIYYPIFIKAGSLITRQAKETTGLENVALMGADGMFSPDVSSGAGDASEGLFVSSPDLSAFSAKVQHLLPAKVPGNVRIRADQHLPCSRL